tara:strand:+ start:517 stop:1068 length:552 start_codon:yes stop_codon:yes gene_type:complete
MFNALKLWWKNIFKHIDDGYTNTEEDSNNYTSLTDESITLGEESYAYVDKKLPHLVLCHPPLEEDLTLEEFMDTLENPSDTLTPRDENPSDTLTPRDENPIDTVTPRDTLLDLHLSTHPNFQPKLSPVVPKPPPISLKQRFQQRQYRAFLDDNTTDIPSKNTRSKRRKKKKLGFRDCLTQTSP